jgi:nonsense-mediated mRNA decay protein 3
VTEAVEEAAFCIECGDPDPVADGLCLKCLRETLDIVKGPTAPVEMERCVHCDAVPVREHWDQPTSLLEAIEQAALGSVLIPGELDEPRIAVAARQQDAKNYTVEVEVQGTYKQVAVGGTAPVKVRLQNTACDACSRRHGGYFEATVQVRKDGEGEVTEQEAGDIAVMIEEEVRRLGGLSGSQSYLLKAEARHGGYDYFFGTKAAAKAVAGRIADRYGASKEFTTTLVGERDGQELHRLTVSVRLPRVTPGTVLHYDDEVLEVYGRDGNRILATTVPDEESRTVEERNLEHATVLDPVTVDVVYADEGEGEILDPDSYDSVAVRLPEGVASGDAVRAVRHRSSWWVLGEAERDDEAA